MGIALPAAGGALLSERESQRGLQVIEEFHAQELANKAWAFAKWSHQRL